MSRIVSGCRARGRPGRVDVSAETVALIWRTSRLACDRIRTLAELAGSNQSDGRDVVVAQTLFESSAQCIDSPHTLVRA
jgi:hypothetical protein